jgi:lysophospholipase L1-like esterase
VINDAIGGRSARTYFDEGRWARVAASIKPGDIVLVQFGHNDQGRIGDPANKHRADGHGIGPETVNDTMPDGSTEAVHTFGWYMGAFASEAKAHGATVVICAPIPHKQRWQNGRDFAELAQWDSAVAATNGVLFMDLTLVVTDAYKKMGAEKADALFADKETHTTDAGAQLNASCVIAGLKGLKENPLAGFLSDKGREVQPDSPDETISTKAPSPQ